MKERSGADSNVEFQSGTTKKVVKPTPRPKSIGKVYTNQPIRKPMTSEHKKADTYTGKVFNPEPKYKKPKKNLPLSGKQKRRNHLFHLSLPEVLRVDQMHYTECHN